MKLKATDELQYAPDGVWIPVPVVSEAVPEHPHEVEDRTRQAETSKVIEKLMDDFSNNERENQMHYRNGREAKNGDKIVQLGNSGDIQAFGVLHSAAPGNDYCNGNIAVIQSATQYACMVDCLHVDDVAVFLTEKGLDKRPAGK